MEVANPKLVICEDEEGFTIDKVFQNYDFQKIIQDIVHTNHQGDPLPLGSGRNWVHFPKLYILSSQSILTQEKLQVVAFIFST